MDWLMVDCCADRLLSKESIRSEWTKALAERAITTKIEEYRRKKRTIETRKD
jgi:hypothetical protein